MLDSTATGSEYRLSLRARLVLGVIVLAVAGLPAAGVATYASLYSFLIDAPTSRCRRPGGGTSRSTRGSATTARTGRRSLSRKQLPASPGAIRHRRGRLHLTQSGSTRPPRRRPASRCRGSGRPDATSPLVRGRWEPVRLRASSDPHSGATVIVATRCRRGIEAPPTFLIEVLVAGAVSPGSRRSASGSCASAFGPWHDGQDGPGDCGGRPDQERRRAESRTEVGRLGMALNTMLGRIAVRSRPRTRSERRLRRFVADVSHDCGRPSQRSAPMPSCSQGAARNPADLERSMRGIGGESVRM